MTTQQQVVRNETRTWLRQPWILSAFIGIAITVVFLLSWFREGASLANQTAAPAYTNLSLIPQFVADGEVHRMFTANLLHSSVWSLLASLLTLAVVGTEVESRWGVRRYLASAVIVSLGATLPVLMFEPVVSRWATGNGAVMGLIGAALVVARRAGYRIWMIVAVAIIDLLVYLFLTPESTPWAPIGGVFTGAIIALLLIVAPQDRRRNKVQAAFLGAFFLALVAITAYQIISR